MFSFFFNDTPPTEIYTLSLHDALPIYTFLFGVIILIANILKRAFSSQLADIRDERSEERFSRNAETDLVCRLLLEKKKRTKNYYGEMSTHLSPHLTRSCWCCPRCLLLAS